jgi:hypothetical protein
MTLPNSTGENTMLNQVDIEDILKLFYPKAVSPERIETLIREAIEELKVKHAHALLNQHLAEQALHSEQQLALALQALKQVRTETLPLAGNYDETYQDQWLGLRQQMSLIPDTVLRDAQADIEPKLLAFKKATLSLQNFRAVHKIKRECKQPNLYKALFLKVLAVVAESKINCQLLSGLTAYAGSESLILAITLSVLNLGIGSLVGICLNYTRHVDAPVRQKAWLVSLSLDGVQLSLVYCVTLLIEWSQANSFDTEIALQQMLAQGAAFWPWDLSLEPIRFLGVTLFFALLAAMLVFTGQYCDPYPHYSSVFKRYLQAKNELQHALSHWINALDQPAETNLHELTAHSENMNSQYRLLLADEALMTQMVNGLDALIKAHTHAFNEAASLLEKRANTLMADRRGTYQPMTTPVFNNPLQADLAGLQSVESRLKSSLQQFQAGVQTMAVALQQQHQQARRQFVDDIQQRLNRILQGDVDQEDSIPEPQATTQKTTFWGGNS